MTLHRTHHLMDSQLSKQHTFLRDGTVIFLDDILGEMPLLQWTWDETYDRSLQEARESLVKTSMLGCETSHSCSGRIIGSTL